MHDRGQPLPPEPAGIRARDTLSCSTTDPCRLLWVEDHKWVLVDPTWLQNSPSQELTQWSDS